MTNPTDQYCELISQNALAAQSSHQPESLTVRFTLLDRIVDLLIQQAKTSEYWPETFVRTLQVLEGLPLPADRFALVVTRLHNANDYASRSEFGAAAFELRLLRGQLID